MSSPPENSSAHSDSTGDGSFPANERRHTPSSRPVEDGERTWDADYPPDAAHFNEESAYQEAYEEWSHRVKQRLGIDPKEWPRVVNLTGIVAMCKEAFGASRSTFYQCYRSYFEFTADEKVAYRDEILFQMLVVNSTDRTSSREAREERSDL